MGFSQTLTLAFSIFALFVGAGNVIFPPVVGLTAGPDFLLAYLGFIATGDNVGALSVLFLLMQNTIFTFQLSTALQL